jgi:hypothetical protein
VGILRDVRQGGSGRRFDLAVAANHLEPLLHAGRLLEFLGVERAVVVGVEEVEEVPDGLVPADPEGLIADPQVQAQDVRSVGMQEHDVLFVPRQHRGAGGGGQRQKKTEQGGRCHGIPSPPISPARRDC